MTTTNPTLTKEHIDYLVKLRDSGEVNMWGASVYLSETFNVPQTVAVSLLSQWIETFKND